MSRHEITIPVIISGNYTWDRCEQLLDWYQQLHGQYEGGAGLYKVTCCNLRYFEKQLSCISMGGRICAFNSPEKGGSD